MSDEPLVQLLEVLQSSLAMYLADSGLSTYPGQPEIRLALADLTSDHRNLVDRGAIVLEERQIQVPKSVYPLSYTGLHDVDLRHVVPRIVAELRRQAGAFERLAADPFDAMTAELAADALRSTRQHIDVLEQIATRLRAGLSTRHPAPAAASASPESGGAASAVAPAAS